MNNDLKKRIVESPRIGVNKLAEYITTNDPVRRRRIIEDCKYPKTYIIATYNEVRPVINNYFLGAEDDVSIAETIERIGKDKPNTDFEKKVQKCSIESLNHFLNFDKEPFEGLGFYSPEDEYKLMINEVIISVNPDLFIEYHKRGVRHLGAIKIHISKTNSLSSDAQKIVAAIMYYYLTEHFSDSDSKINPKLCFSSDIFRENVEFSPGTYVRIMNSVREACEEIAGRWESL